MTATALQRLRHIERIALFVFFAGAIAAAVLGWLSPPALVPAWRLAAFACLQPALGSLIFVLIHRLTGGQWAQGLAPFLLSGTRLLPWIWVLVLPLLLWPIAGRPASAEVGADLRAAQTSNDESLSVRAHQAMAIPGGEVAAPAASTTSNPGPLGARPLPQTIEMDASLDRVFTRSGRTMGDPLRWYFSRPVLVARAVLYAVVFFLLAFGAPRAMSATTTLRWFGPLGLIGLVLILHLLATDWIIMLDPGWFSTGFPLVWISAQAIAGIALAIAAGVTSGANPAERGPAGHVRGFDWGNLMLAAIMVWAYVAFVQLLIIWSGNLPDETAWYRHRDFGAWRWLGAAVAAIEFGAPFFLLLSRAVKKRRRGLSLVTALLVIGQLGYTSWLIVPAFPGASLQIALQLAMLVAAFALFLNRYLAGARVIAVPLASP